MKLIKQSFEILDQQCGLEGIYKQIERAGRTCYKSEDKITEDSAKEFVDRMIKSGHGAMLEHGTVYLAMPTETMIPIEANGWGKYTKNPYSRGFKVCIVNGQERVAITTNLRVLVENNWLDDLQYICEPTEFHERRICVKFICSRAIANELVRHRVFSFSQESSRYCNYSKERFGANITYIIPYWIDENLINDCQFNGDVFQDTDNKDLIKVGRFKASLKQCEYDYLELIRNGCSAQEAREVLPLCTKTELVMTGFEKDWKQLFELRTSNAAHPDMRNLIIPLKEKLKF